MTSRQRKDPEENERVTTGALSHLDSGEEPRNAPAFGRGQITGDWRGVGTRGEGVESIQSEGSRVQSR